MIKTMTVSFYLRFLVERLDADRAAAVVKAVLIPWQTCPKLHLQAVPRR